MPVSHTMTKFHQNDNLIQQFKDKKITVDEMDRLIAMAAIQAKLLTVEIAAQKVAIMDKGAMKRLTGSGLISSTSIPVAEDVTELFPCREQGDCNITRTSCLDYSGQSRHMDACQKCEEFTRTRKQVCP